MVFSHYFEQLLKAVTVYIDAGLVHSIDELEDVDIAVCMLVFCGQRLLHGDLAVREGDGANLVNDFLWAVQAGHLVEGDFFGVVPLHL